ncbi:MAG TPA: ribosome-associated translation inhibitor RaiA [Rudaea sp.]|jgi:putative sigma-54 modulation protein|uniref:ribosome hibernation-promoting factor, HPF/YfiA family n=1 Tax=Rudaea sp. TaxID=2136325 RepID=UPI002F91F664
MQIIVSGHQVIVTPALRDYAESKLGRIVRHCEQLHDAAVVLTVEKLYQKAEATLHCAANKTIHADATAADLYAAIDTLADKLDRQVKKHKEKLGNHHREAVRETRYG